MPTNCVFILRNEEFDFIDDELMPERIQCNFDEY